MVDLPGPGTPPPAIGKAIGWQLEIAGQRIDHSSAWADITVSMDSGIAPGSVTLEIRGLSAEQFAAIAGAQLPAENAHGIREGAPQVLFATLHLYWRDRQALDGQIAQELAIMQKEQEMKDLAKKNEALNKQLNDGKTQEAKKAQELNKLKKAQTAPLPVE